MITREALLAHVRPLVEAVAVDLASILWARLEGQLDQALDAARSALASDLASIDAPVVPVAPRVLSPAEVKVHRDRANMLRREADAAAAARVPNPRRTATCRNCGRVGFTSKGCGTTHQPLTEPAAIVSLPPARAAREPAPAPSPIPPTAVEVEVEVEAVEIEPDLEPEPEPDDSEPAPQDDDEEAEIEVVAPAPRPGRRDRFAEIEALAKAREATAGTRRSA